MIEVKVFLAIVSFPFKVANKVESPGVISAFTISVISAASKSVFKVPSNIFTAVYVALSDP